MNFQFDVNGDKISGIITKFRYDDNDLIGLATVATQFGEIEIAVFHHWTIDKYLSDVPYSFLRGETGKFEIQLDTSAITKSEIDSIITYHQALIDIQDWQLAMATKTLIITGTISEDYWMLAGIIKV